MGALGSVAAWLSPVPADAIVNVPVAGSLYWSLRELNLDLVLLERIRSARRNKFRRGLRGPNTLVVLHDYAFHIRTTNHINVSPANNTDPELNSR
jgi:hypothetical protein